MLSSVQASTARAKPSGRRSTAPSDRRSFRACLKLEKVGSRFLSLRQHGPAQHSPLPREGLRRPGALRGLARTSGQAPAYSAAGPSLFGPGSLKLWTALVWYGLAEALGSKALRASACEASSREHSHGREALTSKRWERVGRDPMRTLRRVSFNVRSWPEAEWLLSGEQSGEADISFPAGLDPKRTADQRRLRATRGPSDRGRPRVSCRRLPAGQAADIVSSFQ